LRALVLLLALAAPAGAQDAETLADIRQSLTVLSTEMEGLRRELSTTGAPSITLPRSALERLDAIEAALRDLTARTEALTGRVDRVVRDGTNRVGDLEFRLTELEGGDVAALEPPEPLGGEAPAAPAEPAPAAEGAELATAEETDYERALAASEGGDAAEAARLLGAFAETYPGSPLAGEAQLRRGEALREEGDLPGAARAFLAGFSGDPNGEAAAGNLLALGRALGELGQAPEACTTFAEVRVRFPEGPEAEEAGEAARALDCP
jgi:tol-pal system protein YbgF